MNKVRHRLRGLIIKGKQIRCYELTPRLDTRVTSSRDNFDRKIFRSPCGKIKPRHPHPEGSQSGVREVAVAGKSPALSLAVCR